MSGWWCGFFVFRVVSVFSDLLFYNRWNLQLPLFLRNLCNCWYGVGVDPQFREEKRYENELGQGKKTHTPVTRHSEALLGSSMAESARWRGKKWKNKLNEGRERLGVEGESERNIKKGEGKGGERIGGGGGGEPILGEGRFWLWRRRGWMGWNLLWRPIKVGWDKQQQHASASVI